MKKVLDITANNTPYQEGFNINLEITGRIVVKDDNTFEGIICDSDDSFLVTGNINKKNIEMLLQEEDHNKLYVAKRDGKFYYGDCFISVGDLKQPIGQAMIRITDPKTYRFVDNDSEIEYIENEISEKRHTK